MARIDPDSWRRMTELFEQALELPSHEREAFARTSLADEPELREELLGMLRAESSGSSAMPSMPAVPLDSVDVSLVGRRVSDFELVRQIGAGGVGAVYEARQLDPERSVAFKTLRFDVGGESVRERLRQESQILARLSHPAIAQVYEAGVLNVGTEQLPWFAMEFVVDALPIVEFASSRDLDPRARIDLAMRAIRGIEYAHGRGVVHRDIKSSNVLVDADGQVKIIDFGIARLRAGDGTDSNLTRTGDLLGTLSTMAPEQFSRAVGSTDHRVDVYALGCLIYELLCGVPPIPVRGLDVLGAARRISEEPIRRPLEAEHALGRDARWILERALAKRPTDRYATAGALADDLERLLRREAVAAGPPTKTYRLRSFVRRYRAGVAATAAVFLALLLGVLGLAIGIVRARDSAAEAEAERDRVLQLAARRTLTQLESEAGDLWPPWPENLDAMNAWLARAELLRARLPDLEETMAVLESRPLEDSSDRAESSLFGVEAQVWWREELSSAIADIRALFGSDGLAGDGKHPDHGWGMARRVAHAHTLDLTRDSILADEWSETRARIGASERYAKFDMPALAGLRPLGPDPDSGLEEFAALDSGRMLARDADGRLILEEESAAVLVLIPGGTYWIGCQIKDPDAPLYVPLDKAPGLLPNEVVASPFLIGKHELTVSQWHIMLGADPPEADYNYNLMGTQGSVPIDLAESTLARFELGIPDAHAWEIAARGGTVTRWWTGDDRASLVGKVNLGDASAARSGAPWNKGDPMPDVDDGYTMLAPIDALPTNPFGLHHVVGNMAEWVRLRYDFHAGKGENRRVIPIDSPALAGFGFMSPAQTTAIGQYNSVAGSSPAMDTGYRLFRAVTEAGVPVPTVEHGPR